jgi:DNA-binding SARP family transcriptional activator
LNTAVGSREEIEALTAADALYRGPYLDTYDEPWMVVRRGELSRLHVRVLRRLVERAIEDGPAERALELGARLARLQPRSRMACELYLRTLRAAGELERATQVERAFARRTTAPDDTTSASSRTRRA